MLEIEIVPCLRDNYAYLLWSSRSANAIVIDPSEAAPVEVVLERRGLRLCAALATHHHRDHVGGAPELCARYGVPLELHETDASRLGGLGVSVLAKREGDLREFAGATIDLVHVPGHTLGAACFVVRESGLPMRLFTGDTLFLAGCGRIFEGSAPMLRASLERIAALAHDAELYCGHEYTAANLAFARAVEPSNEAPEEALGRARARACTMPGSLALERTTNPFLRTAVGSRFVVDGQTIEGDADAVFAALRAAKDVFRGP